MTHPRAAALGVLAVLVATAALLVSESLRHHVVSAQGVGRASWTPSSSSTEAITSQFLVPDDSITYSNESSWSQSQVQGLRGTGKVAVPRERQSLMQQPKFEHDASTLSEDAQAALDRAAKPP